MEAIIFISVIVILALFMAFRFVQYHFYNKGYNAASKKLTDNFNHKIYDENYIVHSGINPTERVAIYEKEHTEDNKKISFFGIGIKYIKNKYNESKSAFNIDVYKEGDAPYRETVVIGATGVTDGYHTFADLYKYRAHYNAALVNLITKLNKTPLTYNYQLDAIKSKKHYDGSKCYNGNYFVVMIKTPFGQIINHYENKYWDLFNCRAASRAWKWDGSKTKDNFDRLAKLSKYLIEQK